MSEWHYELVQDGMVVAEVDASSSEAGLREIMHYAMVYSQDGPVTIQEPEGQNTLRSLFPASHQDTRP